MNTQNKSADMITLLREWKKACVSLAFDPDSGSQRRPAAPNSMAGRIEHTLLGVSATNRDVERLCREAMKHSFRAVCCMPRDVERCARALGSSSVLVVSVIDFPLGGGIGGAAASQCRMVIDLGASEVDMVIDVRAIVQSELTLARDIVAGVVETAANVPVKVILETGALTPDQVAHAIAVAESGGATFVKTSTGFGARGASIEDVALMRAIVLGRMGVKASGGIRDRATAVAMVEAGADVIGTSNGPDCI
jgi:deoxyribose-phosphate aldolase